MLVGSVDEAQPDSTRDSWTLLTMRSNRSTLFALMVAVAIAALVLAALRTRSESWNSFFFLATSASFVLGFIAAGSRNGRRRARLLGFAALGSAYLALSVAEFDLPTTPLTAILDTWLNQPRSADAPWALFDPIPGAYMFGGSGTSFPPYHDLIGDCLYSLVVAISAGWVAPLLVTQDDLMNVAPSARPQARRWFRVVAFALVVGLGLGVVGVGLNQAPGPTAALALLGTGAVFALGLVVAVSSEGNRRAGWLGFALFGAGYLTVVFGPESLPATWPRIVGDQLINAIASVLPYAAESDFTDPVDLFDLANKRVQAVLDRRVFLQVEGEMTLEEFLKAVRRVAVGPDGQPIPIHVDPQGLRDADKTMASTLVVDCDGVRLRTALRFALGQLFLTYNIIEGVVFITASSSDGSEPLGTTLPIHVVGHCVLGLMTATLGGLVARRVAGPRPEPTLDPTQTANP